VNIQTSSSRAINALLVAVQLAVAIYQSAEIRNDIHAIKSALGEERAERAGIKRDLDEIKFKILSKGSARIKD